MESPDSSDDEFLILLVRRRQKLLQKKQRNRRYYVRALNETRLMRGEFNVLCPDVRELDEETHFFLFRMSKERFDDLLQRVRPLITHPQNHRYPIPPEQRLALTLRLLAHGESQRYTAVRDRIGQKTANQIFDETCKAIWRILQPELVPEPSLEQWRRIAEDFWQFWDFPNCVGAIDGKHVVCKAPPRSGSLYRNYKGTFSIVLMASVDAKYCFTFVDVGACGRDSDGGVFANSTFGQRLNSESLGIPGFKPLPGTDIMFPHIFVGDEAFPLRHSLMRPYPGTKVGNLSERKRVFNYRLSRARRIVENGFGILAARWRILLKPMELYPERAQTATLAMVALHNYLMKTDNAASPTVRYAPDHFADYTADDGTTYPGEWRKLIDNTVPNRIPRLSSNNYDKVAKDTRERLADYFMSPPGERPWQYVVANRGLD